MPVIFEEMEKKIDIFYSCPSDFGMPINTKLK
jgi:hypothetical protein